MFCRMWSSEEGHGCNLMICLCKVIQAVEEIRRSFFPDLKRILLGTPYVIEEQLRGLV